MHIIRFSTNDFFAVRSCENMRIQQSTLMSQGWGDEAGCWCGKQVIRYIGLYIQTILFFGFCCGSYCMMKLRALYLTHYICKHWALYAVHIFIFSLCLRRHTGLYIQTISSHFLLFFLFLGFICEPYFVWWLDTLGYICSPLPYFRDICAF